MSSKVVGLIFVLLAVTLESFAQIAFKLGAEATRPTKTRRARLGAIALGVFLYVLEAGAWTIALSRFPVSAAYPLGSLVIVGVALLSRAVLGERVSRTRWTGIVLIVAGAAVVGGEA